MDTVSMICIAEEPIPTEQQVAVLEHLKQSSLALKRVQNFRYEVRKGVLILLGSCSSFYHKQCAQNAVSTALPELEIQNEIEVPEAT